MSTSATPAAPTSASDAKATAPDTTKPLVAPKEVEPTDEYEIDGKKVMLTRTQARTFIQKAGAADRRMQEATEKQKQLDALLKLADENPEEWLRRTKKDPEAADKLTAAYLERKAKLALLSPEQQAAEKLKEDNAALQKRLDDLQKSQEEETRQKQDEQTQGAIEQQLIAAADKYGLDQTPEVLEGLADVALDLMSYGAIPTGDAVAQEFQRRELEHLETRDKKFVERLKGPKLKEFLKGYAPKLIALPAAELLEVLGPAGIRAIQAATLTRVPAAAKKPPPPPPAPPTNGRTTLPARNNEGKFINEHDFDRKFRR